MPPTLCLVSWHAPRRATPVRAGEGLYQGSAAVGVAVQSELHADCVFGMQCRPQLAENRLHCTN